MWTKWALMGTKCRVLAASATPNICTSPTTSNHMDYIIAEFVFVRILQSQDFA